MRRKIIFSTLVLFFILASGVVKAQDGKLSFGGGLAYGSDIESAGIFVKGNYAINETWEAAADFTYFFPKDYGYNVKLHWMALNLDGHYVFARPDKMAFYGLAGLDFLIARIPAYEINSYKVEAQSDSNIGLNLGAGGRYSISESLSGMAEAKFVIADGSYFQIGVGLVYTF